MRRFNCCHKYRRPTGRPRSPATWVKLGCAQTRWSWLRRQWVSADERFAQPRSGSASALGDCCSDRHVKARAVGFALHLDRGALPGRAASRCRPIRGSTLVLRPRVHQRGRFVQRRASRAMDTSRSPCLEGHVTGFLACSIRGFFRLMRPSLGEPLIPRLRRSVCGRDSRVSAPCNAGQELPVSMSLAAPCRVAS